MKTAILTIALVLELLVPSSSFATAACEQNSPSRSARADEAAVLWTLNFEEMIIRADEKCSNRFSSRDDSGFRQVVCQVCLERPVTRTSRIGERRVLEIGQFDDQRRTLTYNLSTSTQNPTTLRCWGDITQILNSFALISGQELARYLRKMGVTCSIQVSDLPIAERPDGVIKASFREQGIKKGAD